MHANFKPATNLLTRPLCPYRLPLPPPVTRKVFLVPRANSHKSHKKLHECKNLPPNGKKTKRKCHEKSSASSKRAFSCAFPALGISFTPACPAIGCCRFNCATPCPYSASSPPAITTANSRLNSTHSDAPSEIGSARPQMPLLLLLFLATSEW